jgi:hypothetical protein
MKTRELLIAVMGCGATGLALWTDPMCRAQSARSTDEASGAAKAATGNPTRSTQEESTEVDLSDPTREANDLGNNTQSSRFGPMNGMAPNLASGFYFSDGKLAGHGAISVTTFSKPDQKVVDQIAEDLRILSYLFSRNLERAFEGDPPDYKLGIPMLMAADGHSVGASYLEGFGVVLKMRVGFPLVAPTGDKTEPAAAQPGSEWDEARRALSGAEAPENGAGGEFAANLWGESMHTIVAAGPYDPKRVETLKRRTLALLKNASNLRHLKADEWIAVSITGAPVPGRTRPWRLHGPAGNFSAYTLILDNSDSGRATMMTIRVKKADVDAFAAGKLSEEQFAKQAEVASYLATAPQDRLAMGTAGGRRGSKP